MSTQSGKLDTQGLIARTHVSIEVSVLQLSAKFLKQLPRVSMPYHLDEIKQYEWLCWMDGEATLGREYRDHNVALVRNLFEQPLLVCYVTGRMNGTDMIIWADSQHGGDGCIVIPFVLVQ